MAQDIEALAKLLGIKPARGLEVRILLAWDAEPMIEILERQDDARLAPKIARSYERLSSWTVYDVGSSGNRMLCMSVKPGEANDSWTIMETGASAESPASISPPSA